MEIVTLTLSSLSILSKFRLILEKKIRSKFSLILC